MKKPIDIKSLYNADKHANTVKIVDHITGGNGLGMRCMYYASILKCLIDHEVEEAGGVSPLES